MDDLFEQFWNVYPHCVSKGSAIKSFEKVITEHGEEILPKLLLAIQAQVRYRNEAKSLDQFMPNWKMPATWLNQQCWLDEIPSHAKLKEVLNQKKCSFDDCERSTMGDRFDVCDKHYADKYCDFTDNKTFLKKNNLYKTKTESTKQWSDRCRQHLEKTGFSKWIKNATSVTRRNT